MRFYFNKLASIFFFTLLTFTAFSQDKTITYLYDPSYKIADREFELYHTHARLHILPYDTLVKGEVEFEIKVLRENIDSLVFEVPELVVSSVKIDGREATFHNRGNIIIINASADMTWQSLHKVLFIYTAKPSQGLYFVGWNDAQQIKRKQIWAHRPQHWLPYTPAIHTIDMEVTVPGGLKVFSNGERKEIITNKDDTKTWVYAMNHPHPFFSTCLIIGDYEYKSLETKRGLPLELWYYPEWEDHFEPTYRYQTAMFDFFEDEFDFAYPWEVYRQAPVIDYMYGAMETTTATIFGDFLMVDERAYFGRNYVNVNAHELAHQWFGNYISHLKHKDVWLTESFATYWAKMFEKHQFGEDHYQTIRNTELLDALEGSAKNNYSVGHSWGGRERIYQKGSLVMDMLRGIMGDREFKAVMKYYLENHPYQTAETNDLLQAIRKVTGRSMEWFFEEWIYRSGEPEYKIAYEQLPGEVRLEVAQIHKQDEITGLFTMPVDIEVYFMDGSKILMETRIDKEFQQLSINNPENKKVAFLLFDPNRKIIKTVKFERSLDELKAQAQLAENMIDRYDALFAMRDFAVETKTDALFEIYNQETFYLTKTEIIFQISDAWENEKVKALIVGAIGDKDDKIRLAALQAFPVIPEAFQLEFEKLLYDKSYINVELALENLCYSFPQKYGSYLDRTVDETGWRGKNIRMKWLEIAIGRGGIAYIPELKNYTSESYEYETRINAMHVLQRLNIFDAQVADNILSGLFHWNRKIRNASRGVLSSFAGQNAYKAIIINAIAEGNFTEAQIKNMDQWFLD